MFLASLASASSSTIPTSPASASSTQQENYEIDSIVQKMETLNATQEELEDAEIARRFESISEANEAGGGGVEVAEEAMEDLGGESSELPEAAAVDLKDRFRKFTDDGWDLQYVDFLNRENPGEFPTMRFDVSLYNEGMPNDKDPATATADPIWMQMKIKTLLHGRKHRNRQRQAECLPNFRP